MVLVDIISKLNINGDICRYVTTAIIISALQIFFVLSTHESGARSQ